MSFIPDPELTLGSACYLNGNVMYVFGQKVATTKTGTKVQYQVTEQLPDDYTQGKGPFPHPYTWYDRTDVQTPDEFAETELARLEAEANAIYRTLTGKPFVWLYGDATETIICVPDSTALYSDPGVYITDLEDGTANVVITDTTAGPVSDSTNLIVVGAIDLSVAMNYERHYYAVDSGGFESNIVTRVIRVINEPPPDC